MFNKFPGTRPTLLVIVWLSLFSGLLLNSGCQAATPELVSPVAEPPNSPILPDKTGKLSARLQQLADPALSQQDAAAQAQALNLPETGSGSLLRNEQDELLVYIRLADTSAANQQALTEAGATIVNVAEEARTVTAYVGTAELNQLAGLPFVENIREELRP